MADLDELHLVLGAVERAKDPVDAVARVAVDARDAPRVEASDEVIADCLSHATKNVQG